MIVMRKSVNVGGKNCGYSCAYVVETCFAIVRCDLTPPKWKE